MRKLTEEQVNLVCEQYKNGLSTPKLGKQYGVSHKTIMRAIKRKGFLLRGISKSLQRYCLDETVFDVITEESAYWLGFLMADGNICHTKRGKVLKLPVSRRGFPLRSSRRRDNEISQCD